MSDYFIDSLEHKQDADRTSSNKLLAALAKHHGGPVRVDIKAEEDTSRVNLLQAQVRDLKDQIGDMQIVIGRQRRLIVRLAESDDLEYPKVSEIIRAVCDFYNITKANITSNSRTIKFTLPRQVAYFLSRELTRLSLPEIGRRMGGRDHTSVLHGFRKIEGLLKTDEILRDDLDVLRIKIEAQVQVRNIVTEEESAAA